MATRRNLCSNVDDKPGVNGDDVFIAVVDAVDADADGADPDIGVVNVAREAFTLVLRLMSSKSGKFGKGA